MKLPEILHNPEFILGVQEISQLPDDNAVEIAFAGRSNVGKSSAINAITNRRKLARTSKTPGRTQQINFFALNESARLVDLPGYGFAQVPLKVKHHWQRTIHHYLVYRQSLVVLVLLMDIRHPLTELDRQVVEWASEADLRTHVLLTKSDKFKSGKTKATVLSVQKQLGKYSGRFTVQAFSSLKYEGVDQIRGMIAEWTSAD